MDRLTSVPDEIVVEIMVPVRDIVKADGVWPFKAALSVAAKSFKNVDNASVSNVSFESRKELRINF
jgi:hypothetical protein